MGQCLNCKAVGVYAVQHVYSNGTFHQDKYRNKALCVVCVSRQCMRIHMHRALLNKKKGKMGIEICEHHVIISYYSDCAFVDIKLNGFLKNTPSLPESLELGEAHSFHYLNQSGCVSDPTIDDAGDFVKVRVHMSLHPLQE